MGLAELDKLIRDAKHMKTDRKATRHELGLMLDKMLDWAEALKVVIPEIDAEALRIQEQIDALKWANERYMDVFSKMMYLMDHDQPEEALEELRRFRVEVVGPYPGTVIEQ